MREEEHISVDNVHSKYAHTNAFDLAEHKFWRSLTSFRSQDTELTYSLLFFLSTLHFGFCYSFKSFPALK